MGNIIVLVVSCLLWAVLIPIILWVMRLMGLYLTVKEGEARVYTLFGNVKKVIKEPGLHVFPFGLGLQAPLITILGKCYHVDMRLQQRYRRSQPVNTLEGAPMGVGIWYEWRVTNPVLFLFANTNPKESLNSNIGTAVVERLSNLPLSRMLENRHEMSRAVRSTVAPIAAAWGIAVGSCYTRKVHFTDPTMINKIAEKVVNQLRQITSAIRQRGENEVGKITNRAKVSAAEAFAIAQATRPEIVGQTLSEIGEEPEIRDAVLEILRITELANRQQKKGLVLLPENVSVLISAR